MKIDKLSASDFPGIDEAKFDEWKALKLKDKRRKKFIGNYISPPIGVISVLIAKSNVWAWQRRGDVDWKMALFILFWIYVVIISIYLDIATKPLQRLHKELKMSARLRAKKKGVLFAG